MHKKHCLEAHEAELFKYLVCPRAAAVNGSCECSALHRSQPFACGSTPMHVCELLFSVFINIFTGSGVCVLYAAGDEAFP